MSGRDQSVILAGGLGTRLWPLTELVPKPMVRVAGVPYLEHQLRLLQRQAICDTVLLTGFLSEQIEEFFGNGAKLGLNIEYSREETPLGTGGALRAARELLADEFLVIYGDSFLPIDYRQVLRALRDSRAMGVIVVYDNDKDTNVQNNIAIDQNGTIARYDKHSRDDELTCVDAGVLALRREVVDLIPPDEKTSLEEQVFPRLVRQRELIGWITKQRFYDIGTPERLRVIEEFFSDDHYQNTVSR